jgi:uncharacterized membrane protein YfcA
VSLADAILLAAAALAAGAINAIAGGGTLVSFPALIAAGYSAKVANVTNTIAIWPWSVAGSLGYRAELAKQPDNVRAILLPAILGSLAGSAILLSTPESSFRLIVPYLIIGASLLLLFQDQIGVRARRHPLLEGGRAPLPLFQAAIFVVAVYGAYFGAGLGIIALAVMGVLWPDDLQRSNALRVLIALLANGVAAIYFAVFSDVVWEAVAIMAVAAMAGGYGGIAVARRLSRQRLRQAVVLFGLTAGTILLIRNWT